MTEKTYAYPLFFHYGLNSRLKGIYLTEALGRAALAAAKAPSDRADGPDESYTLEEWPANEPVTKLNIRVVASR